MLYANRWLMELPQVCDVADVYYHLADVMVKGWNGWQML